MEKYTKEDILLAGELGEISSIDVKHLISYLDEAKIINKHNIMKGKTFQMTEVHLKLLSELNVVWRDCEYGAPAIDCKRPYGNTSVENDIAEILGWGELTDELMNRAERLHRELETALQIVLVTQKFEPGLYHQKNEYFIKDWKKIN